MPQYAQLLRTFEVRQAKRLRECRHCHAELPRGTQLLIVFVPNIHGAATELGYCQDCAAHMLDNARREVLQIEEALGLRRS